MSKTDENLKAAVAAESLARNRYSYFAEMAQKEGYRYIAKIFEEVAENEKYHAMEELRLLMGDRDTLTNLKEAVNGEQYESEELYPRPLPFNLSNPPRHGWLSSTDCQS
jgi:rubrerythrin